MTTYQTTPAPVLVALKSQLRARFAAEPTLAEVQVWMTPPNEDIPLEDTVVLVRSEIVEEQAYVHPNRSRDDETTIPGFVYAYAVEPDGDDASMVAAMERARVIVEEIVEEVKDNAPVVNQVRSALISRLAWIPFPHEKGGWGCQLNFDITYAVRVF